MKKKNVYITPEHFARAAAIGVSEKMLIQRARKSGWDIEEAVTTPPRAIRKVPEDWVNIAQQNGISRKTFLLRIRTRGWSEEKAATTPPVIGMERDETGRFLPAWAYQATNGEV
jgi:hypothetical protein